MSGSIADFYRGDYVSITLTNKENAVAIDVTGETFFFTMKTDKADVTPYFQKQVTAPVGADATAGIVDMSLESTETDDFAVGTYWYEFQRVTLDVPPKVYTLNQDKVKVLEDLTIAVS